MKQFFVFAAVVMLVAGFVGCTKSEDVSTKKDIKIEFSVADKDGFDLTRAVKNDWAAGDQILVVFKPNGGNWLAQKADTKDNTLTLTRMEDGSWSATQNNWGDELKNSNGGDFFAIHYRGDISLIKGDNNIGGYQFNYTRGELLRMEGGKYSVTDGVMDLGTLALKLRDDAVQFSVQDLALKEGEWVLLVYYDDADNFNTWHDDQCVVLGTFDGCVTFSDGKMGFVDNNWNYSEYIYVESVRNGDDLTFFSHFDEENCLGKLYSETYFFVLCHFNGDDSSAYVFKYAPNPFALLTKGAYLLPPINFKADGVTPVDCLWERFR